MKDGLQNFIMASFDSFGDWFFWTWKVRAVVNRTLGRVSDIPSQIGPSQAGRVEAPLWSYKLGLDNEWIPSDPRTAVGKCASLNVASTPFTGSFQPNRLGQEPSPTISAEYSAQFPWPPTSIPNADVPVDLLPTYTNTAPAVTLPVPTLTGAPASATEGLDGWFNDNDSQGAPTPVAGCTYPIGDPPTFDVLPATPCTGLV
jgi:glucan 1,3-beta-glucosidase